jgi:hypothetical protein
MAALDGRFHMPVVIYPRARRAILAIAALTCFVVFAGTGVALASCPTQPVSTPFSQWGDSNDYFLVPGGSFEGTADQMGWTLSNASLTTGNETFNVNDAGDQQSLTINGGGSATSPYFCVDETMSGLRFFAQQVSAGTDLRVRVLLQTSDGVTVVPLADLADGSMPAWAPTDALGGSARLPSGSTMMVALRFRAPASSGSWQIDDIYVDPYRSG